MNISIAYQTASQAAKNYGRNPSAANALAYNAALVALSQAALAAQVPTPAGQVTAVGVGKGPVV